MTSPNATLALISALTLLAPACGADDDDSAGDTAGTETGATTTSPTTTSATATTAMTTTTLDPDSGSSGVDPGDTTLDDTTLTSSESSTGTIDLEPFSFFVTSLAAMQELSGSPDGFGGDLTFGEDGPGAGLRGADAICAAIAEMSMPGSSAKEWRAFLSASEGEDGNPVNAIDRVGTGPWYDRLGRLVAMTPADLQNERPAGADPAIIDDLPNEDGVPNHQPDPTQPEVDDHDTLTGSDQQGMFVSSDITCSDWTSSQGQEGVRPTIGHSWPRGGGGGGGGGGAHWISDHEAGGCAPGVNIEGGGGPQPGDYSVGAGGGYGGIYCFALQP